MKNFSKFRLHLLPGFLILLVLSSCNLPVGKIDPTQIPLLPMPSAVPTSKPVIILPALTLAQPTLLQLSTNTPVPPTASLPTDVLPSTIPLQATDEPGTLRINYQKGATSAIVEGDIETGQSINYLLAASKGQPFIINLSSANNDVTYAIFGKNDGKIYVDSGSKISSWQMMLSATQDYLIKIIPGITKEHYSLLVNTPARINFDPGAISATRNGVTAGGLTVSYVLQAIANQEMDLTLNAPAKNAVLSVYGFQDGQPYLRYVVESTTFNFTLPSTQDYIIQIVPYAGAQADYTLEITIK